MPDRYWVGGTANWDGTAGTKWSATSGGPGGASVPTTADDVFFDAASGAGTVTIVAGNLGARSINCTGFTGTIAGGAAITVAGSVTLVAAMTYTHTAAVNFTGTGTLTTAGKSFSAVTVNGAGITVTLGDDLNIATRALTLTQGTFTTANFNVTAGSISSSNFNTRTLNLGSSTISLSSSGTPLDFTNPSGLTFNAGTSQINLTNNGLTFGATGAGQTYHNVSFTSTTLGTHTLAGVNTFNNLSFTGPASAGVTQVQLNDRQIVNGTFSTSGTAGNRRIWFRSQTYGIGLRLLTINGSTSLTDADFRDVSVTGTAAPISGTRIGDLRGNSGITFSTPKTVFRIGTGNWSDNQWAATSGGAVNTDNFPLAQDTAVFNNTTTAGTHTMNSAIPYCGTVDMSARTTALTISLGAAQTVYGDWICGTGITVGGSLTTITFSGRNTQTIISNGVAFGHDLSVDSYGGTVQLGDALGFTGVARFLSVSNGTFDTQGFSLGQFQFSSSGTAVRSVFLRASTMSVSASFNVNTTNLTFDAGTSQINITQPTPTITISGSLPLTLNNVSFTSTSSSTVTLPSNLIFNNLTFSPIAATGLNSVVLNGDVTVNQTLTVAGGSAIRRMFVRSGTLGTSRTLTVGTLVANDCDFRDIALAGTASGSSPTRAGNCGGNSGIIFPVAKTVYWNLAGAQNWSATGWAPTSGGTPDINNFPLAQDTAVFDNTGAAGTVTFDQAWNIGSVNAGGRTSAMNLSISTLSPLIHGSWTSGTGLTINNTPGVLTFSGRGTNSITSNGVSFFFNIAVNCVTGTVQLADAITLVDRGFTLQSGTFNAVTFNFTSLLFDGSFSTSRTLLMGSGTWTLTGTGTPWGFATTTNLTFDKGTANIVLSNNTTTARTFNGGGLAYNKLTIGGTTSTSTTTITGNNSFTELASTKTVAHTIALGSTTQQFGAWTVTGTVGNVVTLTGSGTSHVIAGAATSGIDYLAMGSIGFSTLSPGEFYAGANSTGTAGAPVFRTAPPAPRTLYWVGGTGNWGDTARWSLSSGGAGGQAVPTSLDNVIFNSASNATAYTATINVMARCNQLTVAGPASGSLTMAGSAGTGQLFLHGNTSFPSVGFTRTFTCGIVLTGSTTGKTFSSGVSFNGALEVNGIGAGWTFTSAVNVGNNNAITITNGTLNTDGFAVNTAQLSLGVGNNRTLTLGASTVTIPGSGGISFFSLAGNAPLFTLNAGTSQINLTTTIGTTFTGGNQTFNNVSFTGSAGQRDIVGNNTFNNLSFTALAATGLRLINLFGDQVITGTLTLSAGTDATRRSFIRSDTIGTTRTLTVAAFSGTDVDFRDITVTGAAAPISGTRLGNCGGNSGITFPAGVNKFWNLVGGGNLSATAWATTGGGTPDANNFPLAQDTCVFQGTGLNSGATVTIDTFWNIGTIDMSARTANTMTLATGSNQPFIYGNWINGTGTTISGTFAVSFAGRSSQTITSAGRSFTQNIQIQTPGGSVTLQDALTTSATNGVTLIVGTFNTNNFAISAPAFGFTGGNVIAALNIGSSTITISGSSWQTFAQLTVSGTGTITMTSASSKTFDGGGCNFSDITLNQGGAGALTIAGNNIFKDITATQTATSAATISLSTTTQRFTRFTGKGEAGRILTFQGTSASSPATIVYTGFGPATANTVDYLNIIGMRAYPLTNTWYAGNNSINGGTLGWIFEQTPAVLPGNGNFFLMFH